MNQKLKDLLVNLDTYLKSIDEFMKKEHSQELLSNKIVINFIKKIEELLPREEYHSEEEMVENLDLDDDTKILLSFYLEFKNNVIFLDKKMKQTDSDLLLRQYLLDISQYKLLTPTQEKEYFRMLNRGFSEYKSLIIVSNLKLVIHIAKKYRNLGLPFIDLIQEGNLGLIEAIDKFDLSYNCKFSTYAFYRIKRYITKALANQARTIRIPFNKVLMYSQMVKFEQQYSLLNFEAAKPEVVAAEFNWTLETVNELFKMKRSIISLDDQMPKYEGSTESIKDYVADNKINIEDYIVYKTLLEEIKRTLEALPEREQKLIEMRFGLDGNDENTLESIGKVLNLTREGVRKIEKRTLDEIRKEIKIKKI